MVDAKIIKLTTLPPKSKNELELQKLHELYNNSNNLKLSSNSMNSCSFLSTIDTPSNKSINKNE